jgi:hypothetical protein
MKTLAIITGIVGLIVAAFQFAFAVVGAWQMLMVPSVTPGYLMISVSLFSSLLMGVFYVLASSFFLGMAKRL